MPRFRFSIRELFLVILVVAVALGWWIEHRQVNHLQWRLKVVRAWVGLIDTQGTDYPMELFEGEPPERLSGLPISKTPSPLPKN
jgi:hypothetical protein